MNNYASTDAQRIASRINDYRLSLGGGVWDENGEVSALVESLRENLLKQIRERVFVALDREYLASDEPEAGLCTDCGYDKLGFRRFIENGMEWAECPVCRWSFCQ